MTYYSHGKDAEELTLTIYNDRFAVVKEKRKVELNGDETEVQYLNVAQKIETDSIIVEGLNILELNYDYDLVSKSKLMEKYLDRNVFLLDKVTNKRSEYRLLSVASGIVLEDVNTKEIVLDPKEELILPKLPGELIVKPALVWKVRPSKSDQINVSYITKGMEWESNYVVELKEKTFNVSGWVNIQNNAGTTFDNVKVKLIAGDVNRATDENYVYKEAVLYEVDHSAPEPSFEEQSFADYHMYTLQHNTTLKNNQSKQINFIQGEEIPYQRYYTYSQYEDDVQIKLAFDNKQKNNLGLPLPRGKVKVYQADSNDNSLEFIGEDRIDHTPKNETLELYLGNAFDIVCEGDKVDSNKNARGIRTETWEYEVRNRKEEPALMKITHDLYDDIYKSDWKMKETSHDFKKETSHKIVFWVEVPADTVETITFTYEVDEAITVRHT
ncbi:DUF4139 domain-containing protein [Alkalihalobacillus sp. AL-G]|uniref:DUF4139 domain-containing protein n=1 Tax=Alkalihalobacillus sp. AL-G TaxID=2926399 RepID=UPI0027299A8C|nr:DUF4139 domain-containing protein [Alkalihalobacillus sp. AL-G]WLD94428.1 DUF4139 domain-containing protein [Alkalihalobacillus sp. AL-G]